jgi:hypothetical protein
LGYKNACEFIFHIGDNCLGFGWPENETKENKIEALKIKIAEVINKKPIRIPKKQVPDRPPGGPKPVIKSRC